MKISVDRVVNQFIAPKKYLDSQELITSEFYEVNNPRGLYVLIPSWRGRLDYYALIRRKLMKEGYSCIEYSSAPRMLSSDYQMTVELFEEVKNFVSEQIRKLVQEYQLKEVNIIGTSIGCVEALMIANHNEIIKKVVLVAPGCCLAESMWKGIRTQEIRKNMEVKGITLTFLKEQWKTLAPENNIDGLLGKEITVYLSKSDEIIPYELGLQLVQKMKENNLAPLVKENTFFGHYLTILNYYLRPTV
jgi:pimeloyl-ACP methyl ester carboxylesterase